MRILTVLVLAALCSSRLASAADPYELARWNSEQPQSITMTPQGELLVLGSDFANSGGWVIRGFSPTGQLLRVIPGSTDCLGSFFGTNAKVVAAPFGGMYTYSPQCGNASRLTRLDEQGATLWSVVLDGDNRFDDLAVDPEGNALVASAIHNCIFQYDSAGVLVATINTSALNWWQPVRGLTVDAAGILWGASAGGNPTLIKATPDGQILATFPIPQPYGVVDEITGMSSGGGGLIHVCIKAHNGYASVCEFDSAGTLIRYWGPWDGGGYNGGQFSANCDVWSTPAGDVFVSDGNASEIHRFSDATSPATQATVAGVVNTATGGALLQALAGNRLRISGIGSSGNDGVEFPASTPDEGRAIEFDGGLPIDAALDQGGSLTVQMMGTAEGQTASLGSIRVDVVSDGLNVTPNFSDVGATDVHVEAFNDGARVHSCRVPNNTSMHRAAGGSLLKGNPNAIAAAGDGIEGVQVGLKKKPGGQTSGIAFTGSKVITINGSPVLANKLQFTVAAPKQPITAATAVLKVAKPAALLARKGGNSTQEESNLAQVFISAEPAIADTAGDAGGGIRIEPVGTAVLVGGASDDGATVAGIGSSGNDGVELVLNSSSGATHSFGEGMGFSTATDAGAVLEHRVRGKLSCNPDSTIAVSTETVYPDSITLGADFSRIGATGVVITILDNGSVIHEAPYGIAQKVRLVEPGALVGMGTHAASINTSRSNLKDKASVAAGGVKVSVSYKRPVGTLLRGSGPATEAQGLAMPFDLAIGANRYQGDEVRFTAVGGSPVTELTGASIHQKNPGVPKLDTLRLARAGLAVGGTSATNESKGSAHLLAVNGKLVVHNIGSSGQDGASVKSDAPSSVIWVRPKGPGTAGAWPASSDMKFTSMGRRAGGPREALLSVGAEKVGGALRMGPKPLGSLLTAKGLIHTQAITYRLQLLLNGLVVSTVDALDPQADFNRLPDDVFNSAAGPAVEGRWDAPLLVSIVGGASMMADGIRIRPLGDPDNVSAVESMDVEAAGIPSFELGGWQFPVLGVPPGAHAEPEVRLALGRNPIAAGEALDLSVALPRAAWVDLDVFDAQGRRVARLFHGVQAAGIASHRWQPSGSLSSGLYFVRLNSAGTSRSGKFIYME